MVLSSLPVPSGLDDATVRKSVVVRVGAECVAEGVGEWNAVIGGVFAVGLRSGDVVRAFPCAEDKHDKAVGSCVGGDAEGVGSFVSHGVVVP